MIARFTNTDEIYVEAETIEERLLLGVFMRTKSRGQVQIKIKECIAQCNVVGFGAMTLIANHPEVEKDCPTKWEKKEKK